MNAHYSQFDMFAKPISEMRIETPASRRIQSAPLAKSMDPQTSHIAADRLRKSGKIAPQVQFVADTIIRFCGPDGKTTSEIAALSGVDRSLLAKRVSLAETAKLVVRGKKRVCTVTGFDAEPWSAPNKANEIAR